MASFLRKLIPQSVVNKLDHLPNAIAATTRYGHPAKDMTVVGVTGTDGKTTTTSLIHHLLRSAQVRTGMITTVEAILNDTHFDTGFHTTTPSAWKMQQLLHQAKLSSVTHMVVESTSIGLDQHRLYGIPFQIGVLTNITHDHLDYHQTYDKYLLSKAKLFDHVKFAVLNQDDQSYDAMRKYLDNNNPQATLITYAIDDESANLRATNIVLKPDGLSFIAKVNHPNFATTELKFKIESNLIGEFNIYNLLATISTGFALGFQHQEITRSLQDFHQVAGRQELISIQDRQVVIDFAHTPNALDVLLKSLRQIFPNRRLFVMFGATGQRDQSKRQLMGELACTLADVVVFTSDDTYLEPINHIHRQLISGAALTPSQRISPDDKVLPSQPIYLTIPDRQSAINWISQKSKPTDVIAMLGKGHEKSINLEGIEYPWSEKEAVLLAFNNLDSD